MTATQFVFTTESGYQQTVDRLKSQVAELVDDTTPTAIRVFKDTSIYDYTFGRNKVNAISNYPAFLITAGNEEPAENNIPASTVTFVCYMCFSSTGSTYGKTANEAFSKLRKILKSTPNNGFFKITSVPRDTKPPAGLTTTGNENFWSIQFDVTAKQVKY